MLKVGPSVFHGLILRTNLCGGGCFALDLTDEGTLRKERFNCTRLRPSWRLQHRRLKQVRAYGPRSPRHSWWSFPIHKATKSSVASRENTHEYPKDRFQVAEKQRDAISTWSSENKLDQSCFIQKQDSYLTSVFYHCGFFYWKWWKPYKETLKITRQELPSFFLKVRGENIP